MSNADGASRYETVITYARDTLKAAMLINGGAAVAVLAFIGKIWSSNAGSEVTVLLPSALATFSLGVLLAGIACIFGAYRLE